MDAINRDDAILMIQRHGVGCFDPDEFSPEMSERFVIHMLEELPVARPTRKRGRWVNDYNGKNTYDYHCSECQQKLCLCGKNIVEHMHDGYHLFCNRCGSEMEVDDADSD